MVPRLRILNTDVNHKAQIYVPMVAAFLCVGTILLVIGFKESSHLAGAYGIAVLTTFITTDIQIYWAIFGMKFSTPRRVGLFLALTAFLIIDCAFFSSNLAEKFLIGGWLPVSVGSILTLLMLAWFNGRRATRKAFLKAAEANDSKITSLPGLLQAIDTLSVSPGTGIFLIPEFVEHEELPKSFTTLLQVTSSIPERTVFLNLNFEKDLPFVAESQRVEVVAVVDGVYRVNVKLGFAEPLSDIKLKQHVDSVLPNLAPLAGHSLRSGEEWYFIHTENVHASKNRWWFSRMVVTVYKAMLTISTGAADFFGIPEEKLIQLGSHLVI